MKLTNNFRSPYLFRFYLYSLSNKEFFENFSSDTALFKHSHKKEKQSETATATAGSPLQFPVDLVTFTEEIPDGKLHFCAVKLKLVAEYKYSDRPIGWSL